jgi:pyruvate,water dikinase
MAEVLPGVLTPLGWTFWRDPAEAGMRGSFVDVGVLPRSAGTPPPGVDDRLTALFYGRYAANLSLIASLCDLIPGSSGESFEIQIFGGADPDVLRGKSARRYPVVATRMPRMVATLRHRLVTARAEVESWWRQALRAPAGTPVARIGVARDQLRRALRIHLFCSLVAQGCYDQLARLAVRAQRPGLELELMTGYGGMEESRISADLWRVSRGTTTMAQFLDRYGYHGPGVGELSSHSWREDATPVGELAHTYTGMPDHDAPHRREAERIAVRRAAERRLLAALPAARRPLARAALRAASTFVPLREVGKAAFLQTIDAGRAAARDLGRQLADSGQLADPDDVFFLTWDELRAERPVPDAADLVDQRRALHRHYLGLRLPEHWTGPPTPVPADDGGTELSGVPVYPGVVEGRARVVTDPCSAAGFEPGDILVCETTDPSWVVFFHLASAVVIDVGGPLSHGAIVARELGLPAVINTRRAVRLIRDGDRIRVDGTTGAVVVCAPLADSN